VRFAASGADAGLRVKLGADTVHTIVVLDGSSGLRVDALTDAVSSQVMPSGGANTGFGGTAPPHPPASPAPWLLLIGGGVALSAAGYGGLRQLGRVAA
jgi:hypothetical protein